MENTALKTLIGDTVEQITLADSAFCLKGALERLEDASYSDKDNAILVH